MTAAREALVYCEVDIEVCSLTYGTAPCTASVPSTGAQKCFNTRASCQDLPNFATSTVTLRFSKAALYYPADIEAFPILADVSISPAKISLGEDLGQRESVTLTFDEMRHSDTGPGFDKYLADRSYNPYDQGSFWGKFRSRQPFTKGRALRLYRGFVGQSLAEMECRHYIIESTNGPASGRFQITAKDPLKVLDGDRAQAPRLNLGALTGSLASGGTSATLAPAGIGNTDYPASGWAAIGGKEVMSFTRSGDTLTLANRGSYGTTAVAHAAGDRVQVCLLYTGEDPADIISDLMQTYGGVDAALIPLSEWEAETAAHNRQIYTTIIAEPTPVRKLVSELVVQAGLAIWSDVVTQKIRLQVLRQIPADAALYDESIILEGSLSVEEQLEKRLTEVWTYFAQRNPLEGQEDPSNYREVKVTKDTDAEANYGSAAIKKIYSRWIPTGGSSVASRLNDIQLGRYVEPPRLVGFSVMRTETEAIQQGGGYTIEAQPLQDFDGSDLQLGVQVTQITPEADRFIIEAESITWTSYDSDDLSNRSISIETDQNNINLRAIHDALYPPAVGGDVVTFTISGAVTIGSTSPGSPAVDTDTWGTETLIGNRTSGSPVITGVADTSDAVVGAYVSGTGIPLDTKILSIVPNTSITLDQNATSGAGTSTTLTCYVVRIILNINGAVKGAGGPGGTGANGLGNVPGTNGQAGGTALKVRTYIDLVLATTADVFGGGGGGGGGTCQTFDDHSGGGGGGGAGSTPGAGGTGLGNAEDGQPGSTTAGGLGGRSWTNTTGLIFDGPEPESGIVGGTGGGYGLAGGSPSDGPVPAGDGGAAGFAIDGSSLANMTDAGADIRGSQVN